jgi:hypothetical protein
MSIFNRLRAVRDRRAYERAVKVRERFSPYGVMYGKMVAYQRSTNPTPRKEVARERIAANNEMKGTVKEAFMTHPAATEEDFERCWPAIRDDIFKEYTRKVLELMCM